MQYLRMYVVSVTFTQMLRNIKHFLGALLGNKRDTLGMGYNALNLSYRGGCIVCN